MQFGGKRNVFENVVEEIKSLISVGALKEGDKLPSVRAFAVERKINPNTVAKAYAVLEEQGFICVQPKKGAYVLGKQEKESELARIKEQIVAWKEKGINEEEMMKALKEAYHS